MTQMASGLGGFGLSYEIEEPLLANCSKGFILPLTVLSECLCLVLIGSCHTSKRIWQKPTTIFLIAD